MNDWKIDAAGLALALELDRVPLREATDWPDAMILQQERPDYRLIELSLARTVDVAVEHLNALSAGVGPHDRVLAFFDRVLPLNDLEPQEADGMIVYLTRVLDECEDDEASNLSSCLSYHDDAIEMAVAGIYGSPTACVQQFIEDITALVSEWRSNGRDHRKAFET